MLTTGWSMFWGTSMVALWCLLSGQSFVLPHTTSYVLGLLHLAIFGSVVAFICYFTLINRIGSNKAVYIGVITPVISVLLSIRLEHYRPGPAEWLGMALCLGSVAWALRAPASSANVGKKSMCAVSLSTLPGWNWPGQRQNAGTRVPPW